MNLYQRGQRSSEAESPQFSACCRCLNYAMVYGVSLHKYVLWRRGVLNSPFVRDPQKINLNADDISAVESLVAVASPMRHTVATFQFELSSHDPSIRPSTRATGALSPKDAVSNNCLHSGQRVLAYSRPDPRNIMIFAGIRPVYPTDISRPSACIRYCDIVASCAAHFQP